ncbi:putative RNA-binding protein with PUA-like domain [Rhodoligotrophos appendicifer]|uniref:EVE domain-containing protein n=1 Tax=Rhodoligotrophos appendicifer TaxID=987056 RepID=UPI001180A168|nr:EVE domain-containing protein [Rhodoligotrophos appendicifer]
MAYWLFKTEPGSWSWEDQKRKGKDGEPWTGVRNYQARNNMLAMKVGDLGFFYHSVDEKQVVGIVRVIAEAHPDATATDGKWSCVDVAAVEDMPKPVTLDAVKSEPKLKDMVLANNSRLSVQPVSAEEWSTVCKLGGLSKVPK